VGFHFAKEFVGAIAVGISLLVISVVIRFGATVFVSATAFRPALMSAPFITTAVDVLGVNLFQLSAANFAV